MKLALQLQNILSYQLDSDQLRSLRRQLAGWRDQVAEHTRIVTTSSSYIKSVIVLPKSLRRMRGLGATASGPRLENKMQGPIDSQLGGLIKNQNLK